MKPHLRSLRRGQEVWALIEECIERNELIVNFGGDLIRVGNSTGRLFRAGQRVLLQVESLVPLRFKLMLRSSKRPHSSLNLTV